MYQYMRAKGRVMKCATSEHFQFICMTLVVIKVMVYWNACVIAVFGCSEPEAPAYGYIKRDRDRAEIHCHNPEDMWEIFCHDGEWQGGVGNCSAG